MLPEPFKYHRRPVMVTGAGGGIGGAVVVHLRNLGFEVIAAVHQEADRERLALTWPDVEVIQFDVADEDQRRAAMEGRMLFGLVNAAAFLNVGLVTDVAPADVGRQLATLVVGPVHLATLALPGMRARGRGRVVNITSAFVRDAPPLFAWYRAAKVGLQAIT